MAQDIRKMFQEDEQRSLPKAKLEKGHRQRFEARLDKAFPQEKKQVSPDRFLWLKIAAVLVVLLGVGGFFLTQENPFQGPQVVDTPSETGEEQQPAGNQYQLSDVSPEFKKIENYYLASLNVELAKLEINDQNRALVDSFMSQLAELDKEYNRLNLEIQENGLSETGVEALIRNLQLRLELLYKLKNKIKDINESKNKNYENLQA